MQLIKFKIPLFGDIMEKNGTIGILPEFLARMHEAPRLFTMINDWLSQVRLDDEFLYQNQRSEMVSDGEQTESSQRGFSSLD
jgi:hypothetical protein